MGTGLPRRINLLWVLAALLGTAAVHAAIRVVHFPEPSKEVMSHFAAVAAGFATSVAEGRLQTLAREAFAPASPWAAGSPAPPAVVAALARGARQAERCRCRPVLRSLEFFHVNLANRTVSSRTPLSAGSAPALADSLLEAAVFDTAQSGESLRLHFISAADGSTLAVLLSSQYDSTGAAVAEYGLVTPARELIEQIFGASLGSSLSPDELPVPHQSLDIATASGAQLLQASGPAMPFHSTIRPRGLFSELAITAGLDPPTGMIASLQSLSREKLWLSGILGMSTVLLVVLAAVSSRREALLARARSDFIAGVSHELRMPLAQIMLASETLAEEREPDDRARLGLATSIVREARRLATLVDNVLLVARSGAVTLRPTLTAVDVESLFADVVESVDLAVEDAGRRLEIKAPTGLAVLGDRQLLRQALTNLIDNACKYGGAGQTIRLGAEETQDGVHLYLENDGPGIPAGERKRLFEPYQRLARDQTSERTGAGLGLAVVAQIAKACGGSVWLEDAKPSGTRAVLALAKAPAGRPS
jgi:signal transduction histidine kinase